MISKSLKKNIHILSTISKIKNVKTREKVLIEFLKDNRFYESLQEIAHNTIKGNIPLKKHHKKHLRKCKKGIICLSNPKFSKDHKKLASQLKGGFWTYLIPVVFELLRSLT